MKKTTKKKIEKYCRMFFIYALLPSFCFISLSLCVFVNYVGAAEFEDLTDLYSKNTFLDTLTKGNNIFSVLYQSSQALKYPTSSITSSVPATNAQNELLLPQSSLNITLSPPKNVFPIIKSYLKNGGEFTNTTGYSVDTVPLLNASYPISAEADKSLPLVLIVHTHATESYYETQNEFSDILKPNKDVIGYYDENTPTRTTDTEKNVVHIGRLFSERLESYGIKTVHCTVLHDEENFNLAYNYAGKTIEEYLKKYPSIKYVIDIHRDSLVRTNGEKLCPIANADGEEIAQVMLVVGTDYSGSYHPNWQKNLSVALKLDKIINEKCTGVSRGVYLRTAKFNQQYLIGSMLLEIGSCGNTLKQAEKAALLTADAFYTLLLQNHTFI